MFASFSFILPLALLAHAPVPASAQRFFCGACPTSTPVTPFDSTAFAANTWYEVRRYSNWLQVRSTCVQWVYSETNATTLTANTTMKDMFGNTQSLIGTLTQDDVAADSADYTYFITDLPGPLGPLPGSLDYKILAYNQTSGYAVAWSCKNKFFNWFNSQLLWVLTTSRTPTAAVTDAAIAAITSAGLNANKLQTTVQTGC